jgi:hypothetical protein
MLPDGEACFGQPLTFEPNARKDLAERVAALLDFELTRHNILRQEGTSGTEFAVIATGGTTASKTMLFRSIGFAETTGLGGAGGIICSPRFRGGFGAGGGSLFGFVGSNLIKQHDDFRSGATTTAAPPGVNRTR